MRPLVFIPLLFVSSLASADQVTVALVRVPRAAAGAAADPTSEVRRSLAQLEVTVLPTERSAALLERDLKARRARKKVADAVARASLLRRRMQYDEAAAVLQNTARDAVDGLLQFVDPRLLGQAHLQRGLVLLPTRPQEARRALRLSFAIHPASIEEGAYSPKILAELNSAATRTAPAPTISADEASIAASVLKAEYLILPSVGEGSGKELRLAVFDATRRSWRRTTLSVDEASQGQLVDILRALLRLRPRRPPPADPVAPVVVPSASPDSSADRAKRPMWPWIAASAGLATAVLGTTLWVLSNDRLRTAEDLAGRDPLVEYGAEAESLESSARDLRAGAIVSLIAAGVAATAAAIGWLSVDRKGKRSGRARRVGIGFDGQRVLVSFP